MRSRTVLTIGPALLLVALGLVLSRGHGLSEDLLLDRFASRIENGSDFIRRYVTERERDELRIARSRFSSARIDVDEYTTSMEDLGFEAAVLLDHQGRLLAIHPRRPELLGTEIASRYAHLAAAVRGESAVSDVVPSAARGFPVVAIAVPFETPFGRRVMSGAFSVEIGPLGSFLEGLLPFNSARSYLIDRHGVIAASSGTPRNDIAHLRTVEPELARLATTPGAAGVKPHPVVIGGQSYRTVSLPVRDTPWHLVARVSDAELLGPLRASEWFSWLVFAGIALSAAATAYLLGRLSTSQRELERTLKAQRRTSDALDRFASVAAHDLRSPLATIRMATDLLTEPRLKDDQRTYVAESIRRQTDRGLVLVEELLDLARASGIPRIERVTPEELVDAIREGCPEAQIATGTLDGPLWADRVMLRQALLNLARNGVAYGVRDGEVKIEISTERDAETAIISVADSGPGVPLEARDDLFVPFRRGSQPSKPGAGLGLAIVRATAEAHGGRVWYEEDPTGGAIFRLALPIPRTSR